MSLLWLRVAVLLYGIAALAVLPAALYDRPRWRHIAIPATIAAVLFHFVSLAEMLNAAHHRLPVDTHQTETPLGPLLALAFPLFFWRYKTVPPGLFIPPLFFPPGLFPAFRPGQEAPASVSFPIPMTHPGWIF